MPGSDHSGDAAGLASPIYNWLSALGALFSVGGLTATAFFFLAGIVRTEGAGYSVLAFVPPLGIAAVGGAMALAGYVRERWRQQRGRHSSFHSRWVIDPSRLIRGVSPLVLGGGVVIGTLAVLSGGAGSLAALDYMESNAFCGEVCHQIMSPEASVFADSPHSGLRCVECHVGSGGDSHVTAKMNGLRQVYLALSGDIRRPIPTPIHNRLSSREMCESCHSVDRLDEFKVVSHSYFPSGEDGGEDTLRMLVKVGSGNGGLMEGAGIHYHMLRERRVEYIARDPQRQDIAWVRVTDEDGAVREYSNEEEPLTEEERGALATRSMECVDCHSRPAHRFPSPVASVNAAMAAGRLPRDVPYLKEAAVVALAGDFETREQALAELPGRLREYYEEEYPDEFEEYGEALDGAVPALQAIYRGTLFPEMKADWRAHPDNSGHLDTPGCFRCHNDVMLDSDGEGIASDCSSCHAILSQGEKLVEATEFDLGRAFVHPEDWDTIEEFTLCSECHTGGAEVYE